MHKTLIFAWLLFFESIGFADLITPENLRAYNLCCTLKYFAEDHVNRLPSNWDELNVYIVSEKIKDIPSPSDYALIADAPSTSLLAGWGQMLAICRKSSYQPGEISLGRFVIYRTKDGRIVYSWFAEEHIQKIIAETHIILPPPPPPPGVASPVSIGSTIGQPQEIGASSLPLQVTSLQSAIATPASSTSQAPSTSKTGIPWWIYGIIVSSIVVVVSAGYYLWSRERNGP